MVGKLQSTFWNGFIVTNHEITSLMKIAVERRAKKMIMRNTIVMIQKRLQLWRRRGRGRGQGWEGGQGGGRWGGRGGGRGRGRRGGGTGL